MESDLKLSHSYKLKGGASYRLVPTRGNEVDLEVNGIVLSTYANRHEARMAAVDHAERAGTTDIKGLVDMPNIGLWLEKIVDVGQGAD